MLLQHACENTDYKDTHLHGLHGVRSIVMNRLPLAPGVRVSKTSYVDHITVVEGNKHSQDTCGWMHWLLEQTKINDRVFWQIFQSPHLQGLEVKLRLHQISLRFRHCSTDTQKYSFRNKWENKNSLHRRNLQKDLALKRLSLSAHEIKKQKHATCTE